MPKIVATRIWRIVVHPLHGLKFNRTEKKWIFGPLFDTQAQRMTIEPWLKQRLLRVDGREYSLRDTLKFIANKEAVHVDIRKEVSARDMERVHFGHTTYPHIVVSTAIESCSIWPSKIAHLAEVSSTGLI